MQSGHSSHLSDSLYGASLSDDKTVMWHCILAEDLQSLKVYKSKVQCLKQDLLVQERLHFAVHLCRLGSEN